MCADVAGPPSDQHAHGDEPNRSRSDADLHRSSTTPDRVLPARATSTSYDRPVTVRHAAPSRPRAARHARRVRTHGVLRSVALVAVAVLTFTVAGGVAVAAKLQGNLHYVDVSALVAPVPSPSTPPDPDD